MEQESFEFLATGVLPSLRDDGLSQGQAGVGSELATLTEVVLEFDLGFLVLALQKKRLSAPIGGARHLKESEGHVRLFRETGAQQRIHEPDADLGRLCGREVLVSQQALKFQRSDV